MKIQPSVRITAVVLALTLVVAAISFAQTGALSLLMHGSVVSDNVRIIDGHAYVPLVDVAKAYHQTLVKRPDGFELTSESASAPTETPPTHAASSQTGSWGLSVTGIDQVTSYTLRYDPSGSAVAPTNADDGLVVVTCRVTNGSASDRIFGLSNYFTTLTDDQGNPHKPIAFDAASVRTFGAWRGVSVPAGGTQKIAVVFSISQESAPKTFSFSLMNLTAAGFDTAHRKDVRIPL